MMMKIREITVKDIPSILPLYVSYYNEQEGCCWTEATAQKRIHQVFHMEDFYGLILKCSGTIVGFAMGYFKQYDDLVGYYLDEIVIATEHQNKGYGSALLKELEAHVYEKGAACVELQAVAEEQHEHFYGKAGYHDAVNFVLKENGLMPFFFLWTFDHWQGILFVMQRYVAIGDFYEQNRKSNIYQYVYDI